VIILFLSITKPYGNFVVLKYVNNIFDNLTCMSMTVPSNDTKDMSVWTQDEASSVLQGVSV